MDHIHRFMGMLGKTEYWDGYCGYSLTQKTLHSGIEYHACDLHVRNAEERRIAQRWFAWYALLDVFEPSTWYKSKTLRFCGYREIIVEVD